MRQICCYERTNFDFAIDNVSNAIYNINIATVNNINRVQYDYIITVAKMQ